MIQGCCCGQGVQSRARDEREVSEEMMMQECQAQKRKSRKKRREKWKQFV